MFPMITVRLPAVRAAVTSFGVSAATCLRCRTPAPIAQLTPCVVVISCIRMPDAGLLMSGGEGLPRNVGGMGES